MSARSTLDRYTGKSVEWHFANISNAKIRRALFVGGFGFKYVSFFLFFLSFIIFLVYLVSYFCTG